MLKLQVNGYSFFADWADNTSAEALREKLRKEGPLSLDMEDYANFEKVGDLPWRLPQNNQPTQTELHPKS